MTTPDPSREFLLALAIFHGVHNEVAEAVKGKPSPRFQSLGQLLRSTRLRQGRTIQDVHAACGVSRSQLSFYENGNAKNPSVRVLTQLAVGYRLPLARVLLAAVNEVRTGCEDVVASV